MSVLRVRFHGRGGQGMKTASRILGSAAFHAGYEVQDSPVYGAERRGAPMMAFTRISRDPILERGAIERPHLAIIADDTLLDDPASSPLAGCDESATVLLNTNREAGSHTGRMLRLDLTELALRTTSSLVSLSTAVGAAAASLVGLREEDVLHAIDDELSSLDSDRLERNASLAREVFALGAGWSRLDWPAAAEAVERSADLVELELDSARRAAPSVYASGNTVERHTGSWRQFRPILEPEHCSRCWLCFVWCPEAAIALDDEEYPRLNYDLCKGCLLCAHECPTHAFRIDREVRGATS